MKNLRQFSSITLLTLVLAMSAFADGYMDTDKTPLPPNSTGQMDAGRTGHRETDKTSSDPASGGAIDPVIKLALALLRGVLSLY